MGGNIWCVFREKPLSILFLRRCVPVGPKSCAVKNWNKIRMNLFQVGCLLLDLWFIFLQHIAISRYNHRLRNSTGFIESGKGHKIMKCVVKKAPTSSTGRFYWHRSNGQWQPGREIYFKDCELSQKTVRKRQIRTRNSIQSGVQRKRRRQVKRLRSKWNNCMSGCT